MYQKVRRTSAAVTQNSSTNKNADSSHSGDSSPKGMFPSLMERAFLPQIVSQVRNYLKRIYNIHGQLVMANITNVVCESAIEDLVDAFTFTLYLLQSPL